MKKVDRCFSKYRYRLKKRKTRRLLSKIRKKLKRYWRTFFVVNKNYLFKIKSFFINKNNKNTRPLKKIDDSYNKDINKKTFQRIPSTDSNFKTLEKSNNQITSVPLHRLTPYSQKLWKYHIIQATFLEHRLIIQQAFINHNCFLVTKVLRQQPIACLATNMETIPVYNAADEALFPKIFKQSLPIFDQEKYILFLGYLKSIGKSDTDFINQYHGQIPNENGYNQEKLTVDSLLYGIDKSTDETFEIQKQIKDIKRNIKKSKKHNTSIKELEIILNRLQDNLLQSENKRMTLMNNLGKIDLNYQNKQGRTLCHVLASYGDYALLEDLVTSKLLYPFVKDYSGHLPRDIANNNKNFIDRKCMKNTQSFLNNFSYEKWESLCSWPDMVRFDFISIPSNT